MLNSIANFFSKNKKVVLFSVLFFAVLIAVTVIFPEFMLSNTTNNIILMASLILFPLFATVCFISMLTTKGGLYEDNGKPKKEVLNKIFVMGILSLFNTSFAIAAFLLYLKI